METSRAMIQSAQCLCDAVNALMFAPPVTHIYNPLDYAWAAHEAYLRRYANNQKRVLFLGMNPGPEAKIGCPPNEHPKRRVKGFACPRSEISGQRLWGLFAERFGAADNFFSQHLVVNYCPLAFLETSGRNRTPDKLPAAEREKLFAACDKHLREVVRVLRPEWLVGVGDFAAKRAEQIFSGEQLRLGRILHPSPASPAANQDWAKVAAAQLRELGIWR
jgi:single-strand selective monofunctional uracil DNA glycosylase